LAHVGLWLALVSSLWFAPAAAHEIRPAVADVSVGATEVRIALRVVLEPMVAGIDAGEFQDTNDSPLAGHHDRLRALPPAELEAAFRAAWPGIRARITLLAGETPVAPELRAVSVPEVGDPALPRDSRLELVAQLPPDGTPVRFGWAAALGPVAVRQAEGGADAYAALLSGGATSEPLPRTGVVTETAGATFARFVVAGFEHIVPKGLDHILFVLGLYFYALAMRPLLAQVTAFTLAHTVTLGLASAGIVAVPATIVEPLIALSIVFVAVENVVGGRLGWTRVAVVFGFGLLHGLGFASVLQDVGLEAGRFAVGLIGFNVGVEIGQLAVILAAFLLLGLPFGRQAWYRRAIAVPASLAIAAIGAWWTAERLGLV
jgi:hypothetical protein